MVMESASWYQNTKKTIKKVISVVVEKLHICQNISDYLLKTGKINMQLHKKNKGWASFYYFFVKIIKHIFSRWNAICNTI